MRSLEEVLQSVVDVFSPADESFLVNISSRTPEDDTPLHVLLWRLDAEGAIALISAGADVNAIGDMSETPLHVAVTQDLPDAVQSLLAAGANPDIRSEFGITPREKAVTRGAACAALFASGGT
jgi:uncharacterized protein